jgi:hypothetical protein
MCPSAPALELLETPFSRKMPRKPRNEAVRSREYLIPDEVERLMAAAGRLGRHGHRDKTLILIAYRHALRVSELVSLRWDQFDLNRVCSMSGEQRKASKAAIPCGAPSCERCDASSAITRVYPTCSPPSAAVRSRHRPCARSSPGPVARQRSIFLSIPTCCGTAAAITWPIKATTPARSNSTWVMRTFSTRVATPSWLQGALSGAQSPLPSPPPSPAWRSASLA